MISYKVCFVLSLIYVGCCCTSQSSEIATSPTPPKIQWMLTMNEKCDNCSLVEKFRCWDGFPYNNVYVCLFATIDPNERETHRIQCDQCDVMGQILVSSHRTESCMRDVIHNQKALGALAQKSTIEMPDWIVSNQAVISLTLQISILCSLMVMMMHSFCKKPPANVNHQPAIHKKYVYYIDQRPPPQLPERRVESEGHYTIAN